MKLVHKTLLLISCASLSLHSMEQTNQLDFYSINDIYKKAFTFLKYYNPIDTQTPIVLSQIITKTKELKNNYVDEKQIGQFAFKQASSLTYKFFSDEKPSYHNPYYVCVFFERIAQYNAHLEKNQFSHPTQQQFEQYMNNQNLKAAVEKAATFKLFIDLDDFNKKKNVIVDLPMSIATQEFRNLINNISTMKSTHPETIKTIANLLYKENTQGTAEKL